MQTLKQHLELVAPADLAVLIEGETGVGKELVARTLHRASKRAQAPMVYVNCAAIPENLLESELFGHEKGSFTGATSRRIGKFEEAHTGTILLDEVSEMHPQLQSKLLRVIQEREVTRIGSNGAVKVDVRIIATSNRNLEASVKKGEFREDLYFRLNVVNVHLPALRERPSDITALAQFFADKYAEANGVDKKKISGEADNKMKGYPWPGNIRELENTMHRAILMSMEDELEASAVHLQQAGTAAAAPAPTAQNAPDPAGVSSAGQSAAGNDENSDVQNPGAVEALVGRTISDVERDMIINTLEHCLGNRTHAANILGISIRTLRNKLNQYKDAGVSVPASGAGS